MECPAGRYGSAQGSSNATCDGACDVGYYCPPGSTSPRQLPCGSPSVYCGVVRANAKVCVVMVLVGVWGVWDACNFLTHCCVIPA